MIQRGIGVFIGALVSLVLLTHGPRDGRDLAGLHRAPRHRRHRRLGVAAWSSPSGWAAVPSSAAMTRSRARSSGSSTSRTEASRPGAARASR